MLINLKKNLPKCEEKPLCTDHTVHQQSIQNGENESQKFLRAVSHGDLYVIGSVWIEMVRTGLLGQWSIIPTVQAAAPPPAVPTKPPYMKFKDLPIYTSPHYEYKDYLADKERCPALKRKLLHEALQPYVTLSRQTFMKTYGQVKCEVGNYSRDICYAFCKQKQEVLHYLRCPNNLAIRQGILAFGAITGYLFTRKRHLTGKLVGISCGLLATGTLCFPAETDQHFREVAHTAGTGLITFYNFFCNKMVGLRGPVPCPKDMPAIPPDRPPTECAKKKAAEEAKKKK